MTADFGKGFTVTNLKYMRKFYLTFPKSHALRDQLTWTHYRLLMKVENEKARQFYLEECVNSAWSTRQLERQINSFFYERLLSSQDKKGVAAELQKLEPGKKPEDIIRDPYVLEFLGLEQKASFYENKLEQALIDHLQKFLLELGRGFSFGCDRNCSGNIMYWMMLYRMKKMTRKVKRKCYNLLTMEVLL